MIQSYQNHQCIMEINKRFSGFGSFQFSSNKNWSYWKSFKANLYLQSYKRKFDTLKDDKAKDQNSSNIFNAGSKLFFKAKYFSTWKTFKVTNRWTFWKHSLKLKNRSAKNKIVSDMGNYFSSIISAYTKR